ncbi:HNH endonuclease [Burkholderia cenocepacia]|uniref:HNH endonuclease n=1 Tax=Burkholderia cenocepacia TaxID=95486 RepID=UPI0009B08A77|nr:HNH endonuclease [Burkholderia cenocepacia]
MRIALRTSGGRGEYEVAGSHESIRVHDVFDRQIILEMLPGFRFPTNNFVRHTQGKPRIRLLDPHSDSHVYLILASILLLPKPKREIGATPGGKLQIYKDNFSVMSIPFDAVELSATEIVVSPTQMVLSNSTFDSVRLDVIERLRIVMACWEAASKQSSALANAITQHKNAFNSQNVKAVISAAESIRLATIEPDDPLRHVTKDLNLPNLDELMWLGVHATETDEALALGEENLEELQEAARNRMKVWRQVAMRGAAGAKFSLQVREAYDHTCMFTGMRLPKTPMTGSSGVDAAHILPWAEYDLNSVSNGLCLSKLCHWAFDAGILLLTFDDSLSRYELHLSTAALAAESAGLLKLNGLKDIQGVVSTSLLPKESANWPKPSFLKVYNEASNF